MIDAKLHVFLSILARTPEPFLALMALPAAALVFSAWGRWQALPGARWAAGAGTLVFGLLDSALVIALPHLGLSFGRPGLPIFLFTAGRVVLSVVIAWIWRMGAVFQPQALTRQGAKALLLMCGLIHVGLLAAEFDGLYIEPFHLQVSQVYLPLPASPSAGKLRIVQISDLHIERLTRREEQLIETVRDLHPDLIALTGDYLNLDYLSDPVALQEARKLLARLQAPYGVYAVRGTVDRSQVFESLLQGLPITPLEDALLPIPTAGRQMYLLGVANWDRARDRQAMQSLAAKAPPGAYTILLYHTPDLAEDAARAGIDLYLAGHTHGGQVRLPFYGALVTASDYGLRFQGGLYHVDGMALYVSRGIGMEGFGAPRLRFFCPPEVVLISIDL